jgi:Pyruvate/2-oxoacid:ferredoxin oxidoreductase delta subunit
MFQVRPRATEFGCAFDLDYFKGCGICVKEYRCGAIETVPETI